MGLAPDLHNKANIIIKRLLSVYIFLGFYDLKLRVCVSDALRPFRLSGSSVHGMSQARIQEPVVISSSREFSQPRD